MRHCLPAPLSVRSVGADRSGGKDTGGGGAAVAGGESSPRGTPLHDRTNVIDLTGGDDGGALPLQRGGTQQALRESVVAVRQ